jgi:hypothetical protein
MSHKFFAEDRNAKCFQGRIFLHLVHFCLGGLKRQLSPIVENIATSSRSRASVAVIGDRHESNALVT